MKAIGFGTLHVDRLSKVVDELDEFSQEADVLFVEQPRDDPDSSDKFAMLVHNPTLYLTGIILEWFWGILGFVLTGRFKPVDEVATEVVSEKNEIKIEPVDLNLPRRASEVSVTITVLSWIWFCFVIFIFITGLIVSSITVLIGAVAAGFLPIVPFARLTLAERDEIMAKNIEEVLARNTNLNMGCLVAGRGHMDGVFEQLEQSGVETSQTHESKWIRRSL